MRTSITIPEEWGRIVSNALQRPDVLQHVTFMSPMRGNFTFSYLAFSCLSYFSYLHFIFLSYFSFSSFRCLSFSVGINCTPSLFFSHVSLWQSVIVIYIRREHDDCCYNSWKMKINCFQCAPAPANIQTQQRSLQELYLPLVGLLKTSELLVTTDFAKGNKCLVRNDRASWYYWYQCSVVEIVINPRILEISQNTEKSV